MKRQILACGVLALSASLAAAQDKPPAAAPGVAALAVQLEQGIYQEETAGQLDAAAKTYSQIAAQAEATRLLAAQALYRLVVVQTKLKQSADAATTMQRLAAEYPDQTDTIHKAQAALGGTAGLPGSTGESAGAFGGGPSADQKAKAAKLTDEGWHLFQDRKFNDADYAFSSAIHLDRSNLSALTGSGWARLNEDGNLDGLQIDQLFRDAIALDPRNAMALNGLGWYYKKVAKDDDKALENWQLALDADPKATSAMSGLAQTNAELGRFEEAISWYERWLKIDPQNADAKIGLNTVKQNLAAIKEPVAVVNEFLTKMDAGKYAEAFQMTEASISAQGASSVPAGPPGMMSGVPSPIPGNAVTGNPAHAARWEQKWLSEREPMGKVVARKSKAAQLGGSSPNPGGRGGATVPPERLLQVRLTYDTQFEHKKDAFEWVIAVKDNSGKWWISNYSLSTPNADIDPLRAK